MNVIDFARSVIQFTTEGPGNTACTAVSAACGVTLADGTSKQFVLGNACISENMYVKENLVQRPGTQYLQVVSTDNDQFMFIKDRGGASPDLREACSVGSHLSTHNGKGTTLINLTVKMNQCADVRPLTTHQQVSTAILEGQCLNARTSYTDPVDGAMVVMDYPVRCCNAFGDEDRWQVDTGRILTLAHPQTGDLLVERFAPAYIVCNDWDWAELAIFNQCFDGSHAGRFDDIRRLDVRNELFLVQ
jgi:hypothetical protein